MRRSKISFGLAWVCLSVFVHQFDTGNRASAQSADVVVASCDIHDTGESAGAGPPAISIVGARNGVFSGKVVVRSQQPIAGLKAAISELKQGAAAIPVSAVRVRYGVYWDVSIGSFRRPKGGDILLEAPPKEAPVERRNGGAVVPVLVTVQTPKDAKPGVYTGQLTVQAQGLKSTAVPVKVEIRDWTIPDAQDYRTWIELIQSPDTLTEEYGIPLWSEKHWEMIAESMRMIGQTGSRVVYIPLICETNFGNEQSMVRWIKKGEGLYEQDYSIMERYLDLAEKNMGKPKIVVFYAWDVSLKPPKPSEFEIKEEDGEPARTEKAKKAVRYALRDKGPPVTLLDKATGKVERIYLPHYRDGASRALWQPVWDELRARMRKRGLEDKMMLGMNTDIQPTKEQLSFLKEVSGGLQWASCTHHARWVHQEKTSRKDLGDIADVGYTAAALGYQFVLNPAKGRSYGWKNPRLYGIYWRFQYFNTNTHGTIRHEAERNITGKQRGVSHVGADYWYAMKDKRGRRKGAVVDRYAQSFWHSLNIGGWLLAPGPDGPVGTSRLEVFKEGTQECEARILIEDALTNPALRAKLGDDLATRAQQALDERHLALWKERGAPESELNVGLVEYYRDMYSMDKKWNKSAGNKWFMESGWAEQTGKLFDTAGEVAKRLAAK